MACKVERFPVEPIILATWSEPSDALKDSLAECAEVDALIGKNESKVFVINDFRQLKVDLNFIISGMSTQRQNRPGAAGDPRVETILVGTGTFWQVVEKAVKKFPNGGFDVPLYSSVDEALSVARQKIRTWPH